MRSVGFLSTIFLLVLQAAVLSVAFDPSPLQDFCVAIDEPNFKKSAVFVNGKFCKDPKLVKTEYFVFRGLDIPRNTDNKLGSNATLVDVDLFPALNALAISTARIDFAPYGLNPPHFHPRATELLYVSEGRLLVGFVTSNPYRLFAKVLNIGDLFIFPKSLIHFQFNVDDRPALAFAGLNSQNPGVVRIANALFGSYPPVSPDVLSRTFQLDKKAIYYLQKQFKPENN